MAHDILAPYAHLKDDESRGTLHVEFTPGREIIELRWLLDRAMNCVDPKELPKWVSELSARVDARLGDEKPVYVRPADPA